MTEFWIDDESCKVLELNYLLLIKHKYSIIGPSPVILFSVIDFFFENNDSSSTCFSKRMSLWQLLLQLSDLAPLSAVNTRSAVQL